MRETVEELREQLRFWKNKKYELQAKLASAEEAINITQEDLKVAEARGPAHEI